MGGNEIQKLLPWRVSNGSWGLWGGPGSEWRAGGKSGEIRPHLPLPITFHQSKITFIFFICWEFHVRFWKRNLLCFKKFENHALENMLGCIALEDEWSSSNSFIKWVLVTMAEEGGDFFSAYHTGVGKSSGKLSLKLWRSFSQWLDVILLIPCVEYFCEQEYFYEEW